MNFDKIPELSSEELDELIETTTRYGQALIAERDSRAGFTTHSTGSIDPGCICYGNWRTIVKEIEPLLDKEFIETRSGNTYIFCGLLHASDDYYYVMWKEGSLRLLTCVGSIEQDGFTLK